MIVEPKQFDLNNAYPNVLLVGNGVLRGLAAMNNVTCRSWPESLLNLSTNPLTEVEKEGLKAVPYSVQATVIAPTVDRERKDKYIKEFETLTIKDRSLLADLVSLKFDSILTTNYTYEIEDCFHPKFSTIKNKSAFVGQIERRSIKEKTDSKYLLHTFNQFKNSPPIWHIHGEKRRKSSIILTHDEYARLVCELIEENKINRNKYVDFENEVKYKSWLDYFLMSNLYIVGFGMDFSEFDIWWMLNRRKRENQRKGEITYFKTIYDDSRIINALCRLDVNIQEFNIKAYDRTTYYIEFYKRVTDYINNKLKPSKGVL